MCPDSKIGRAQGTFGSPRGLPARTVGSKICIEFHDLIFYEKTFFKKTYRILRLNEDFGLFFVVFLQVHFQNHTKTLNVKNDKMVFFIELFPELKTAITVYEICNFSISVHLYKITQNLQSENMYNNLCKHSRSCF